MAAFRLALFALLALAAALPLHAAETRRIDLTPGGKAGAWVRGPGAGEAAISTRRTPAGDPALALPCSLGAGTDRAYWDARTAHDLSRFGRVALWICAEGDPHAVANVTLYFHSGAGWYGAPFGPPTLKWRRVVLDCAAFLPEDKPAGWGSIDQIRLSFWKGAEGKVTIHIGGVVALGSDVVVVRSSHGAEGAQSAEAMVRTLARAGIDASGMDESDAARGALRGRRIAIFPNNGDLGDDAAAAAAQFVRAGGKLIVCYGLPKPLARLLELSDEGWQKAERPGQFSGMRFGADRPAGAPTLARQASWNITRVQPAGAQVLAEWVDAQGKTSGWPAVTRSQAGIFISHVVLDDDAANKDRMMRALIGSLDPSMWTEMARQSLAAAGALGTWETAPEAIAGIRAAANASGRSARVEAALARAEAALSAANKALADGRPADVLEPAATAKRELLAASAASRSSKDREFRAVWCHDAYGLPGMSWELAITKLKRSGFNAVVPNMLWGGVADYPSAILPNRDSVATRGDQIAACLAACRRAGVEMHVWKVNWNLLGAPDSFVARMRTEGRLQRSSAGAETPWLCPSNPANFALERDSMLEVARRYEVDGIHFDYIRYPDSSACYCAGCRERFVKRFGGEAARWPTDVLEGGPRRADYLEFRREQITRLVRAVSEEAHRVRPGILVSAAVFPNWPSCRDEIGQDWGRWVAEGWLDFVCPMDYTASDDEYATRIAVQRRAVPKGRWLYPGVGASAPGLAPAQVMDQIEIGRKGGADGFIIFNYDQALAADCLPALAAGITERPAAPPHRKSAGR